ncbi:MAG: hypothetical protein E6959_00410, partial [Eikenella corrodens]|nr:hypothetical protein [Eikenella corrodens]
MSLELKRLLPKWGLASQITFAFFGAVALGLLVRFAGGSSVVASAGNLLGSLFVGAAAFRLERAVCLALSAAN